MLLTLSFVSALSAPDRFNSPTHRPNFVEGCLALPEGVEVTLEAFPGEHGQAAGIFYVEIAVRPVPHVGLSPSLAVGSNC